MAVSGQDAVPVYVTDEGTGIPREDLGRIFNPLFTTRLPGMETGLGLSAGDRMARDHGARLSVESTQQHGGTFILELPIWADRKA